MTSELKPDWPPHELWFNGARIAEHMHVSSVKFSGGIPYDLRTTAPAPDMLAEELTRAAADVVAWFDRDRPDLSGDRVRRLRYAVANFSDTRAAAPSPAVKVKALVWHKRDDIEGLHDALSPIGWCYNVTETDDRQFLYEGDPAIEMPPPLAYFDTLEAAKAAAQADYEARILAALEPAPAVDDPRVVALVDALAWIAAADYATVSNAKDKARAALAALDTP